MVNSYFSSGNFFKINVAEPDQHLFCSPGSGSKVEKPIQDLIQVSNIGIQTEKM